MFHDGTKMKCKGEPLICKLARALVIITIYYLPS